jgi:hypothetical protein
MFKHTGLIRVFLGFRSDAVEVFVVLGYVHFDPEDETTTLCCQRPAPITQGRAAIFKKNEDLVPG